MATSCTKIEKFNQLRTNFIKYLDKIDVAVPDAVRDSMPEETMLVMRMQVKPHIDDLENHATKAGIDLSILTDDEKKRAVRYIRAMCELV